jgi:uncharacterized peroxidase-related enzyme
MDLRAELPHLAEDEREAFVLSVANDWRTAELGAADRALCAYAEKLTKTPQAMTRDDVAALRAAGLGDEAIHSAAQVTAYFNYINRVADGLDVELEPEMRGGAGDAPG